MKITAYVMANNEEDVIGQCLEALQWCDELYLFDTGSTDKTKDIAKQKGAIVRDIPFCGFGPTRNAIIKELDTDWIVCFDADEVCSKELSDEMRQAATEEKGKVFKARRKNYLFGKEVRFSGMGSDYRHPVLFKKNFMVYDNAFVHEGYLTQEKVLLLKNTFDHYSFRNLDQLMDKERKYALWGSEKLREKAYHSSFGKAFFHSFFAFIRLYFIKLGFLDGAAGFTIAISNAHSTFFRYLMAIEK